MDINELISLIVNNGAALGCLCYFMYTNNTTTKELKKAIDDLRLLIQKLVDDVDDLKNKAKEE